MDVYCLQCLPLPQLLLYFSDLCTFPVDPVSFIPCMHSNYIVSETLLTSTISIFSHLFISHGHVCTCVQLPLTFINTTFSHVTSQCTADEGFQAETSCLVYCSCYVYCSLKSHVILHCFCLPSSQLPYAPLLSFAGFFLFPRCKLCHSLGMVSRALLQ